MFFFRTVLIRIRNSWRFKIEGPALQLAKDLELLCSNGVYCPYLRVIEAFEAQYFHFLQIFCFIVWVPTDGVGTLRHLHGVVTGIEALDHERSIAVYVLCFEKIPEHRLIIVR